MVVGLLRKLFGGDSPDAGKTGGARSAKLGEPDLEGFVTFVVRSLVDSPDEVKIETTNAENSISLKVACNKQDIGKVIGRKGRTIAAIRALANGAAGRLGTKVSVEVMD